MLVFLATFLITWGRAYCKKKCILHPGLSVHVYKLMHDRGNLQKLEKCLIVKCILLYQSDLHTFSGHYRWLACKFVCGMAAIIDHHL